MNEQLQQWLHDEIAEARAMLDLLKGETKIDVQNIQYQRGRYLALVEVEQLAQNLYKGAAPG